MENTRVQRFDAAVQALGGATEWVVGAQPPTALRAAVERVLGTGK
ncbi:hypothetical protein [Denitromonas iodatirespirans]|nr:hypothetical protein [Denitromonas iodatirespirans]